MKMELEEFNMNFFELNGKVAIVTGGNTGLGQACAVALAKAGADIFITSHKNSFEETKTLVENEGRKFAFYQGDLSKKESIQQVIDLCMLTFGRIDILVNNAGTIRRAPLLEHKDEDWEQVMSLNTNTVYYLSQRVAKIMKEQGGGKIINMSSMLSFQGGKFVPGYTASKHAVAGITKAFANELAPFNIQTNAIAPGYFATNNTAALRADEKRSKEILARIPAGKWGNPSDLMGTVIFLASNASNYINGHILAVDGGWLVR